MTEYQKVTLVASSAAIGKVDINAPVDGSGNVKVTEQGTPTVLLGAGTNEIGKLAGGNADIGTIHLGAGTAEVGKIAAGTASIGTVGLNAGTNEIGKLGASNNNIGDVDIASPLDGNGYVRTAEQYAPVSVAYGMTMLYKNATGDGADADIYTVTTGKTFFLVHAQLNTIAEVNATVATLKIGSGIILKLEAKIDPAGNIASELTETFAPSVPIPIAAGTVFSVTVSAAGMRAHAVISGWEENA